MRNATVLAFVSLLVVGSAALSDDRPIPRQPIGPTDFQMMPVQRLPPADTVRIVNRGDQRLSFSYWDGQSAWRSLSLDAQASTDISCTNCVGAIIVVYHDGTQNQQVSLKEGSIYWLGWSASKGAWLIGPATQ